MLALVLSLAAAQDLTLTVTGDVYVDEVLTVTVEGLAPGQTTWLASGSSVGETCPLVTAPYCVDIDRPKVLLRGTPNGSAITTTVTVPPPGVHHIQAIQASGVSNRYTLIVEEPEVSIESTPTGSTTPPIIVGVSIGCTGDTVDLVSQHIGNADAVVARGWFDGLEVVSHELQLEEASPGAIFFDASAFGLSAPACEDLTWVFEASNPDIETCVIRGDEEDSLRDDGTVDPNCAEI